MKIRNAAAAFGLLSLMSASALLAQPSPTPTPMPTPSSTGSPGLAPLTGSAAEVARVTTLNYIHHLNNTLTNEAFQSEGRFATDAGRNFASGLVTDFQANEQKTVQLAAQENVRLQAFQPATQEVATNAELTTLSGPEYEQIFFGLQLIGLQLAQARLQIYGQLEANPEVKAHIAETLGLVARNLQMAAAAVALGSQPAPSPSATPSPSASPSPSSAAE